MLKKNSGISLLIATINPISNILKNLSRLDRRGLNLQIIIISLGNHNFAPRYLNNNMLLLQYKHKNKSRALNSAVEYSKYEYLAFTDDDCIPKSDWIINLYKSFKENPEVGAVFGRVKAYQPDKNRGKICPLIFDHAKPRFIKEPTCHWQNIGFGCNMAIRKNVFRKVRGFNPLLGPGSPGMSAEDAGISINILKNNLPILYNPKCLIFHNRWLNIRDYQIKNYTYICGNFSCYVYYSLQGEAFARNVIKMNTSEYIYLIKLSIREIFHDGNSMRLINVIKDTYYCIKGSVIGFWLYIK